MQSTKIRFSVAKITFSVKFYYRCVYFFDVRLINLQVLRNMSLKSEREYPFYLTPEQRANWDTYSDRQMELIYTFIEIWYPDYPESLEQFESNIIRLHEAIESYLTDDDENSEAEEFSNKVLAAADQRVYREAVKKKNMN